MRTRKVLVATDGSSHAERAVRQLLVWMTEGNLPADGSDVLLGSVASGGKPALLVLKHPLKVAAD